MGEAKFYGDYFRNRYSAVTGPASDEFRGWLRESGVPDAVAGLFAGEVLKEEYDAPPIFLPEDGITGLNESVPYPLRDGLLLVARCENGDWVAIDCRRAVGSVGFVCHETIHGAADVYDEFVPIGASFEAFMGVLGRDGVFLWDYFQAREFWLEEGTAGPP